MDLAASILAIVIGIAVLVVVAIGSLWLLGCLLAFVLSAFGASITPWTGAAIMFITSVVGVYFGTKRALVDG